jgi:hypothetical protein
MQAPPPTKKKTLESSIVILFPTELLPQFPRVDEIESKQEEKTLPLHVSLLAFKNSTKPYFDFRKNSSDTPKNANKPEATLKQQRPPFFLYFSLPLLSVHRKHVEQ